MNVSDLDLEASRAEYAATIGILFGTIVALIYLLPGPILILGATLIVLTVGSYLIVFVIATYNHSLPRWVQALPIWIILFIPFVVAAVLVTTLDVELSLLSAILLISLILVFFYYWLIVPLALYQQIKEQNRDISIDEWPSLTVLVPAYNEEGYVGPCIESFVDADYPSEKLDVIVIDDGSTDNTFAEAKQAASEIVTPLHKENGGKHSALNYGLKRATTDLIVTVDADSIIEPEALKELVRTFESKPNAGAVAGDVKVSNRGSLVTNIQALEYIIGINTFRRAFDLLGVVTVVPGCLGGFRREILEEVDRYSADTLTEDFDLTVELLKNGVRIYHSNARVHTEVPDTISDLYNQRLRWFRGNLQTVFKHRRVFVDTDFGLVHRVASPYFFLSMGVIPSLGIVIFVVILWMVMNGLWDVFIGLLVLFTSLQVLLSILAIRIEDDDLWLARYAPLTIVGYKQFLDVTLLKSIGDLITKSDLRWTRAQRVRQRDDNRSD